VLGASGEVPVHTQVDCCPPATSQKIGTVGSSKGRRIKVNWLAAVGGVYTFEQQADYVNTLMSTKTL
jgi:hypothetical protein